jgi:transketolase
VRDEFIDTTTRLLDRDPRVAVVLADISAALLDDAARRHPDRVLNVGIREQLMLGVAGGLARTGLRPIAHSYAPFLVERAYEQIKLDLDHQAAAAILVSVGASYDASSVGRTHHSPGDVALIDTLNRWTVHVPGHPAEVPPLLFAAAGHDDPVYLRLSTQSNAAPHDGTGLVPLRRGALATVVAVGPMLDPVLAATEGLDVTVAYTHTPRPFDATGLRALVSGRDVADVVLVEPYLAGTSAHHVADALTALPHRLLALGVTRTDQRRYGTVEDHARLHGLTPERLRASLDAFLGRRTDR